MSDWKDSFTQTILTRGKDLYKSRKVTDLRSYTEGGGTTTYSASVGDASDVFRVSAILSSDNTVKYFRCSCHYFRKANYCKHSAALLFAVSEGEHAPSVPDAGRADMQKKREEEQKKREEEQKRKEKAAREKYEAVPFDDDGKPHFLSFGDSLQRYMPTKETLKRARKIVQDGGVRSITTGESSGRERYLTYSAYVSDDRNLTRNVYIELGRDGIRSISCSPSYSWYSATKAEPQCAVTKVNADGIMELCVHKTATLLSLVRYIENSRDCMDFTDRTAESLIEDFRKETKKVSEKKSGRKYPVDIELSIVPDTDRNSIKAELRISVDGGKYYKVKDSVKLASAAREKGTLSLSTLCSVDFSEAELTQRAEAALKLIDIAESD